MTIIDLDHVNLRTRQLAAMSTFYQNILGLRLGERPPFKVDGAWLYCGTRAAVHLVEVEDQPAGVEPKIEHFAFRAEGLATFLDTLQSAKIAYRVSIVPAMEIRQVNIYDPDGNHIEVAFGPEDEADLSDFTPEAG